MVSNEQKLTTWNVLRHSTFVYIRGALVIFSFFDAATTIALSSHASYNLIAIVKFIDHLCAKSNFLSRSTCLICLRTTHRCPQWPSSDWWSRRNERGRIRYSHRFDSKSNTVANLLRMFWLSYGRLELCVQFEAFGLNIMRCLIDASRSWEHEQCTQSSICSLNKNTWIFGLCLMLRSY